MYNIIVTPDSKLNTVLSAISLAFFLVLAVVVFTLVVVLLSNKHKAKQSKTARIELTKMGELTMETMNPTHTFNVYSSPVHHRYCSEEEVDIM